MTAMPALLGRPVPTLDKLREAVRLRTQIRDLERRLAHLFGRPATGRNAYGFSGSEMTKIGTRLHARAKRRIANGQSREFAGSIDEIL